MPKYQALGLGKQEKHSVENVAIFAINLGKQEKHSVENVAIFAINLGQTENSVSLDTLCSTPCWLGYTASIGNHFNNLVKLV